MLSFNQRQYARMFSSNLIVANKIKRCLIFLCFLKVCKQEIHYFWKTPVDNTGMFFDEELDLVDTTVLLSFSGWLSFSS